MVRTSGGKRKKTESDSTETCDEPHPSTSFDSTTRAKPQTTEKNIRFVYTAEEIRKILAEEDEEGEEDFMHEDDDDDNFPEYLAELQDMEGDDSEEGGPLPDPDPSAATRQVHDREPLPFTLSGSTPTFHSCSTPTEFFNLWLNAEMIDHIIEQTNLYATYLISKAVLPRALIRRWKPLEEEEFKNFLGMLFHMGTIPLHKISDYWNTDPVLFGLPCFRRVMSRDRFILILQALHFAKNPEPDQSTPTDKLYKIRPILDIFHRTTDNLIIPTRNLCIDESMVLWRGRLMFRQYLKNKAHPYDIKMYMLNEASGMVLRFIAYTGSSDQEVGGKGHADKVVRKLMDRKLDLDHSLVRDNFYISVNLVHELLERKTYVTGSLRSNCKGNPPEVVEAKLKRGETVDHYTDEGVFVLKWRDKRDVLMISSEFSGEMVDVSNRRRVVTRKPKAVVKYNKSMGGVDYFDQMMAYYPLERKPLKWSKKMGIHILHICMYNAFTLYNKCFPKMSLYNFRLEVIKSLIPPLVSTTPIVSYKKITKGLSPHFPNSSDAAEGSGRKFRKRCRVCLGKNIRRETIHFCPACPDQPPLCIKKCFQEFHEDMIL